MTAGGPQFGSQIGADPQAFVMGLTGVTTFAMAALNAGWCARFTARDTRDIASVVVNFSTVSSPGVITLRIETLDAATGKPSGSLYDAAATKTFTPAAGFNVVTFDSLPTAGLAAGTEYALLLLTTTGGTTMTLRSHIVNSAGSVAPTAVLTAADGTTRSNLTVVTQAVPIATVLFEDGVEETCGCCPYVAPTSYDLYGTLAAAAKFVVPAGVRYAVDAIEWVELPTGTPAGDLRIRLMTSTGTLVATLTADKDSLLLHTGRNRCRARFTAPVTLSQGTYYVIFDSASSANASNCWTLRGATGRGAQNVPSACQLMSTADVTASPILWVDAPTDCAIVSLCLDSLSGTQTAPLGRTVFP